MNGALCFIRNKLFRIGFSFFDTFHIFFGVLKEAPNHQNHYQPDRERADNTYALNIVHRAFGEHQGDRQNDQQNTPQQSDHHAGFFVLAQTLIAVTRRRIRDRIKACGIERDHTNHNQYKNKCTRRHRFDYADYQSV